MKSYIRSLLSNFVEVVASLNIRKDRIARAIPPIIFVSCTKSLVLGAVTVIVLAHKWCGNHCLGSKVEIAEEPGTDIFEFLLPPWATSLQIYCYGEKKIDPLLNHHELGFLL